MDIEGSEYEVLFSTPIQVLQNIRGIALEHNPDVRDRSPQQLFCNLQKAGFELTEGYGVAHLLERSLLDTIKAAGLEPEVLERGRNARTGAEASQVSLIRAHRR